MAAKPSQKNAAATILASGGTTTGAAQAAGISRRQAGRWLKDPAFIDALAEAKPEAIKAVQNDVAGIVRLAAKELAAFLKSDDRYGARDRARLALQILKATGGLSALPAPPLAAEAADEAEEA